MHGAKVYISSRKHAQCDETAAELSAGGAECISLPQDVSTVDGCKALAARMTALEPRLDILVNNAGAAWGADFDEFPESGWDKVMNLNLKFAFFSHTGAAWGSEGGGVAGSAGQGDQYRLNRRHPAQSSGNLFLSRIQIGIDLPDPAHGRAPDRGQYRSDCDRPRRATPRK